VVYYAMDAVKEGVAKWRGRRFGGDFKKDAGSVRAFVNRFAETPMGAGAKVSHLDYDWSLNEAK